MTRLRVLILLLVLSVFAGAQSVQPALELNGVTDASVAYGQSLQVRVTATPGVVTYVAWNTDPGPTTVLGMSIPLSFGAGVQVSHPGVAMPATGELVDGFLIPGVPALEGLQFFGFCLTVDPGLPFGFGFSNGVSGTFTRPASAGPDTAGLTGERITLDGSAMTAPGPLPMGTTLGWSIVSGPAGHAATLEGADTAFPALVADLPGVYQVEASLLAAGTTGGNGDVADVTVYELDVTSHAQGAFDTSDPVNVSADLNGPAFSAFEATGVATAAGNNVSASLAAGSPATQVAFRATSGGGQIMGRGLTVVNNTGGSLAMPPVDGMITHLKQPVLDSLETALETALGAVNLSGPITGLPSIPVVNVPGLFGTTLFSADVTLQSFSYDPTIDLELTANAGALNVMMTITNVVITFDMSGLLLNVPYTDTGTLTMASVSTSFDLTTTVAGGVYTTTTSNETATISGATLTFTGGVANAFAGTFLGAVVPILEGLFATLIPPALPPLFDGVLNAVPQAIDLSATNALDVTVDLVPGAVDHLAGGMSLRLDAGAHANGIAPGTAPVSAFYATPNAPPVYGANMPGTMTPYNVALSIGDDFINQFFAAAMQAGGLELAIAEPIDILGQTLNSNAGTMNLLFPGTGFDKFDPLAPAYFSLHPTVAPIVTVGAATGEMMSLHASDLVVDIRVEAGPNYDVSVLRFGMVAQAGIDFVVDTVNLTLDIVPGTITASTYPIASMPGVDPTATLTGVNLLLGNIVAGLTGGLTGIPLPDPTGGLLPGTTFVGIMADGPAGDYVSLFFN